MRKLIFLLITFSAILSSCTKNENSGKACNRDNTATLTVSNSSSNPYRITIDGRTVGTLSGYSTQTFTEKAGVWNMRATQVSGYLFTPTIVTDTKAIEACENWQWFIP
jgi:hypothetical protein